MTSRFEAQHPRCGHCGAWGKRFGDRIQCNNPACARTSTYVPPADPLLPEIGYKLPKPRRLSPPPIKNHPPEQEQLDLNGDTPCDE